jgi:transposase
LTVAGARAPGKGWPDVVNRGGLIDIRHSLRHCGRRRQIELIAFLEYLDQKIPADVTRVHIICDNSRVHTGKLTKGWLATHRRFEFHFTPVRCSWMNQIEQWFSIFGRKRLKTADFASRADLGGKIQMFIAEWNQRAHPFNWTTK